MILDVYGRVLHAGDVAVPCSIGRGGLVAATDKCEGDGATPVGVWPLRGVLLRPDRIMPQPLCLPWRWLRAEDGWCDAPGDPSYNRPVRHPHPASAERMWRADELYDIVVVLGHNDRPPVPGAGSAIFLHCWRDGAATEGCVAVARDHLLTLLPTLAPGDEVRIS